MNAVPCKAATATADDAGAVKAAKACRAMRERASTAKAAVPREAPVPTVAEPDIKLPGGNVLGARHMHKTCTTSPRGHQRGGALRPLTTPRPGRATGARHACINTRSECNCRSRYPTETQRRECR
jgi:hypothetical protein